MVTASLLTTLSNNNINNNSTIDSQSPSSFFLSSVLPSSSSSISKQPPLLTPESSSPVIRFGDMVSATSTNSAASTNSTSSTALPPSLQASSTISSHNNSMISTSAIPATGVVSAPVLYDPKSVNNGSGLVGGNADLLAQNQIYSHATSGSRIVSGSSVASLGLSTSNNAAMSSTAGGGGGYYHSPIPGVSFVPRSGSDSLALSPAQPTPQLHSQPTSPHQYAAHTRHNQPHSSADHLSSSGLYDTSSMGAANTLMNAVSPDMINRFVTTATAVNATTATIDGHGINPIMPMRSPTSTLPPATRRRQSTAPTLETPRTVPGLSDLPIPSSSSASYLDSSIDQFEQPLSPSLSSHRARHPYAYTPNGNSDARKRSNGEVVLGTIIPGNNESYTRDPIFSGEGKPGFRLYDIARPHVPVNISLEAKLDKGFTPTTDSSEWTCYRRNYFQVLAAFRLDHPDDIKSKHQQSALSGASQFKGGSSITTYRMDQLRENGSVVGSYNVIQFKIGISARVHGSDRSIQLTQYTAKRDKGPQNAPLQMDCAPGGSVESYHFAPSHSVQLFERLQFKQATQNNGKRKAAQQHYSLVVELFAVCHGGTQHLISTATSGPLVVRGRSPGHYGESPALHMSGKDGEPSSGNRRRYSSAVTISTSNLVSSPTDGNNATMPLDPVPNVNSSGSMNFHDFHRPSINTGNEGLLVDPSASSMATNAQSTLMFGSPTGAVPSVAIVGNGGSIAAGPLSPVVPVAPIQLVPMPIHPYISYPTATALASPLGFDTSNPATAGLIPSAPYLNTRHSISGAAGAVGNADFMMPTAASSYLGYPPMLPSPGNNAPTALSLQPLPVSTSIGSAPIASSDNDSGCIDPRTLVSQQQQPGALYLDSHRASDPTAHSLSIQQQHQQQIQHQAALPLRHRMSEGSVPFHHSSAPLALHSPHLPLPTTTTTTAATATTAAALLLATTALATGAATTAPAAWSSNFTVGSSDSLIESPVNTLSPTESAGRVGPGRPSLSSIPITQFQQLGRGSIHSSLGVPGSAFYSPTSTTTAGVGPNSLSMMPATSITSVANLGSGSVDGSSLGLALAASSVAAGGSGPVNFGGIDMNQTPSWVPAAINATEQAASGSSNVSTSLDIANSISAGSSSNN